MIFFVVVSFSLSLTLHNQISFSVSTAVQQSSKRACMNLRVYVCVCVSSVQTGPHLYVWPMHMLASPIFVFSFSHFVYYALLFDSRLLLLLFVVVVIAHFVVVFIFCSVHSSCLRFCIWCLCFVLALLAIPLISASLSVSVSLSALLVGWPVRLPVPVRCRGAARRAARLASAQGIDSFARCLSPSYYYS